MGSQENARQSEEDRKLVLQNPSQAKRMVQNRNQNESGSQSAEIRQNSPQ